MKELIAKMRLEKDKIPRSDFQETEPSKLSTSHHELSIMSDGGNNKDVNNSLFSAKGQYTSISGGNSITMQQNSIHKAKDSI